MNKKIKLCFLRGGRNVNFSMILGYSRKRSVEFTLSTDTPTLIQSHLNSFQYFGGCTQEILYDNMKQHRIQEDTNS